jgi:hypothetical protein
MERMRIKLKRPHQDIQDEGRMNAPIPLVMRIVILFDWRMEYLLCFIGLKNCHPKPNWMAIYLQFSLVQGRMRRPSIGARDLEAFIGQGEQAQGGQGGLPRKGGFVEVFMERLWKKMKHGMELCVASNRGKASGLLV